MLLNIDDSCLYLQYALSVEPVRYILIMYVTTSVLVTCLFVAFFSLDRTNVDRAYLTVSNEKYT